MAQNDRFIVKHIHGKGWAVKKTNAGRASSVHETQRQAEKRAKEIVLNLGGGEVRIWKNGTLRELDTLSQQ